MSNPLSSHQAWLSTLEDHLNKERYSSNTVGHRLTTVRDFLASR